MRAFATAQARAVAGREATEIRKRATAIGKAGVRITKYALPALLKAGTAGIVDIENWADAFKGAGEVAEKVAQQALDEYDEQKKSLQKFRTELQSLATSLQGEKKRPFVMLVDELDRCRPTYAIELLERIKHLFAVPGVVFVLALDRRQLAATVKAVYGQGFDGDGYLRRHFDFEYRFPSVDPRTYVRFLFEALNFPALVASHRLDGHLADPMLDFVVLSTRALGASPRDIGHVMSRLYVAHAIGEVAGQPDPRALVLLAFLRQRDPELYDTVVARTVDAARLISRFAAVGVATFKGEREAGIFRAYLYLIVHTKSQNRAQAQALNEMALKITDPLEQQFFQLQSEVLSRHGEESRFCGPDIVDYARRRLELAERFRA